MRGVQIYNSLLFDEPTIQLPVKKQSGRSPELIDKRDKFLLHRFYWKTKIERKLYPDALSELSAEVFLESLTIQKIIQAKSDDALLIKKQQPTKNWLKEQWPHIHW